MKQFAKKATKEAERLGYVYARTNSSNFDIYEHPSAGEIGINPSCNEASYRNIVRQMQKSVGVLVRAQGRDAIAVKDRHAKRAELDAERLAAERRDIERQRDVYLARISGAQLTQIDRADLARIERRLAEIRVLERMMTSVPASADHRGRGQARHRAGVA